MDTDGVHVTVIDNGHANTTDEDRMGLMTNASTADKL
jgi:hypothetical protein